MIIKVKKSYWMAAAVLVAHFGAVVCVGMVEMARWMHLALDAAIIASLMWQWRNAFWWKGGELRITEEGLCSTGGNDGPPARIHRADAFAGFIRLRLARSSGRPRTLLLMQDAVPSEVYHELCARIRQGRLPVPDQAAMREPL